MKRLHLTQEQIDDLLTSISARQDDLAESARVWPEEEEESQAGIDRLEALAGLLVCADEMSEEPITTEQTLQAEACYGSEDFQCGDFAEVVDGGMWVEGRVWVPEADEDDEEAQS